MPVKRRVSRGGVPISDREFEMLLRRACECLKTGKPRLLKKSTPGDRAAAPAA
jgi:hypothetical protein